MFRLGPGFWKDVYGRRSIVFKNVFKLPPINSQGNSLVKPKKMDNIYDKIGDNNPKMYVDEASQ